jgi:hypothetical protein
VRRAYIAELVERAAGGKLTADDVRQRRREAARKILEPVRRHPRQWEALLSIIAAILSVLQANRRGGKTYLQGALAESRLLARDNYVVRVLTHRLATPTQNWLDCDGKESMVARLKRLDMLQYATIKRTGDGSIKSIRFDWGSALYVHQFASQSDIDEKHGFNADLYLADEAQYLDLLPLVLTQLVLPTLADTEARVLLSGTPGREVGSFFHRAATGDDPGWSQVRFYSWHNPFFGASHEERWHKIVDTILRPSRGLYALTSDDIERIRGLDATTLELIANNDTPDDLKAWVKTLDSELRRQYFGAWVVGGAEYVFEWHRAPDPLYWCRTSSNRWNERDELLLPVADTLAERIERLPLRQVGHQWLKREWSAIIGCDLGWSPSSTAIVVLAWAGGLDLCYALWSEAEFEQPDDVTLERLADITGELKRAGFLVHGVVADVTGTRKGTGAAWNGQFQRRFQAGKTWIQEPDKANKDEQIRALNLDLLRGRIRLVAGDALDIEGRHLRWKPFDAQAPKPPTIDKWRTVVLGDGRVEQPAEHCLDAARYAAHKVPALFREEIRTTPLTHKEWLDEIHHQAMMAEGMADRVR